MEYKKLVTGEEIPVLGLGTWRMGGSLHPDYSQDSQVVELLQTAIQLGYTHIDTAEVYADGHTEELVGALPAISPGNPSSLRPRSGTPTWDTQQCTNL